MNKDCAAEQGASGFQESLRRSITTPVVFFVQTSTLDVCYAYRNVLQSGMLTSIRGIRKTRAVPRKIFRIRLYCSIFSASFSIQQWCTTFFGHGPLNDLLNPFGGQTGLAT